MDIILPVSSVGQFMFFTLCTKFFLSSISSRSFGFNTSLLLDLNGLETTVIPWVWSSFAGTSDIFLMSAFIVDLTPNLILIFHEKVNLEILPLCWLRNGNVTQFTRVILRNRLDDKLEAAMLLNSLT